MHSDQQLAVADSTKRRGVIPARRLQSRVSQPVSDHAKVRIGFLFNHDQIHHVAHSLPIALALAKAEPAAEVVIATTNQRLRDEVDRILKEHTPTPPLTIVDLRPRTMLSRTIVRLLDRWLPAAKLTVYRDHLEFFSSLDGLVVAEKTSAILKRRYGLSHIKLIHTRHGAGDRAIGFNDASARFDHVLVSGPKIRDRLIAEAKLAPDRMSMVGYPKFDLVPQRALRLPIQANGRPTVLYIPHVSPHLSSWFRHGRAVLDFFVGHPEYNLIFAPHVMLFERPIVLTIDKMRINRPGSIARKYWNAPNIIIDLGSRASTDMTYTLAADLYLGDVSSQVYEFLVERRPCIFLNSHSIDYEGDPNYAHWRTGEVIESPSDLGRALKEAPEKHAGFRAAQDQLFRQRFDLTETPSSARAAEAILSFMLCCSTAQFDPASSPRAAPDSLEKLRPGQAIA